MNADDLIVRYAQLKAGLSAPRGYDPRMIDGYEVASRCSFRHCKAKGPPTLLYNAKSRELEHRCPRCGTVWPRTRAWVPKACMDDCRPPVGAAEAPLAQLATYRQWIEGTLDVWQVRVYPPYVLWQGPGRADLGVALGARERWPEAPWRWTRYRVNDIVDASRRALDARLEEEGIR